MRALRTLWGLLFDDARLVCTLAVALIAAAVLSRAGQALPAAVVIWAGLILSLWFSTGHQLRLKRAKDRDRGA